MPKGLTICAAVWAVCLSASQAARANDVPLELRDKIAEALAPEFIRPQTTIYRFDEIRPYSGGDDIVCGAVNYQSAELKYVGYHAFYAIIHEGAVVLHQVADPGNDVSGALGAKLRAVCPKS